MTIIDFIIGGVIIVVAAVSMIYCHFKSSMKNHGCKLPVEEEPNTLNDYYFYDDELAIVRSFTAEHPPEILDNKIYFRISRNGSMNFIIICNANNHIVKITPATVKGSHICKIIDRQDESITLRFPHVELFELIKQLSIILFYPTIKTYITDCKDTIFESERDYETT